LSSRPAILFLLSILFSWPGSSSAAPQEKEKPKDPPALTRLAEGVYADTAEPDSNAVSNSGIVVLEHSVLVYDTHYTPEAGLVLAGRIRAVTQNPVRYVVLGHYHPDHTHGSQAFDSAALVISSTAGRRDMLQKDIPVMNRAVATTRQQIEKMTKELLALKETSQQEALRRQIKDRQAFLERMSKLKIAQPVVTVDDSLTITEGGRKIELRVIGAGHTDGDLVLYLPDEKVVFCGDLFFNKALPNTQDGSILDWIKTLDELLKLDAEKFLPGHGPVGTKEDVKEFASYLEELRKVVEAGVNRGDGVEQITRDARVPARYSSWQFQNFFPANIQRMYVELKALQLAAPPPQPEPAKKPAQEKPKP
jgi:cyclase